MRFPFVFLAILGVLCALYFAQPQGNHARGWGEAKIGGTFTLIDTHGKTMRDSDFRGKLMLVYMGYSHCPDICPLTLATMSDALKTLGPDAGKVAAIFISLDPGRDSPHALSSFLGAFDPHIIGLTGSPIQVAEAAKAYRVFFKKTPVSATGGYLIDHSGFLYLMDGQGKYLMHFQSDVKAAELANAIKDHL